jgi:hypothetical protein
MVEESIEKFHATGGRLLGVLGLVAALALMVLGAVEGAPVWGVGLVAVIGVLIWASMLRPGVRIVGDRLELRNMFVTLGVPLGAIEDVAVRRFLALRAGDRRFVSPAIGRTLRQTTRPAKRDQPGGGPDGEGRDLVALAARSYPDFVEARIRTAAADHRTRLGIKGWSDEQRALADDVRTDLAWPEIGALAVAVLVLLVGIVLAL